MAFQLTVLAKDTKTEERWARELRVAAEKMSEVSVELASSRKQHGQILFVDASLPELDSVLATIDRKGRAIFLLVESDEKVPAALAAGKVDDVLVHPFRPLEVLSKLSHYQQILMWDEVNRLNASFSEVLERLHEDLQLAERLQKGKLPVRFPEIRGLKAVSRYLAGVKSGGDYFDLAESKDGNLLSFVLTDSSSYGLSSAVLSVMVRVMMKLSQDEVRSSHSTVRRIQEELLVTLGPKDHLSLFYSVLSRKDYRMRFLTLGTSRAFYARPKEPFRELPVQGQALSRLSGPISVSESELVLEPDGRLVVVSDGFVEATGGSEETLGLLNRFRSREAVDTVNELVFGVKSRLQGPDDLPAQDCTAVVFDLDSRLIRLA